jgi:hypothetical protein
VSGTGGAEPATHVFALRSNTTSSASTQLRVRLYSSGVG